MTWTKIYKDMSTIKTIAKNILPDLRLFFNEPPISKDNWLTDEEIKLRTEIENLLINFYLNKTINNK